MELSNSPGESEVEVFRMFFDKLMTLQKQMDRSYDDDIFIRDRRMTGIDRASIQIALRDLTPREAQEPIKRIANRLSKKPKTAGSAYINFESGVIQQVTYEMIYSLGQSYGGVARRYMKTFDNQ